LRWIGLLSIRPAGCRYR